MCIIQNDWKIFEKKRFPGFGKIFNSFFSLSHSSEAPVPLNNKRVRFSSISKEVDLLSITDDDIKKANEDITLIEQNANYIREYNEMKVKFNCSIDMLLTWSLVINDKPITGINIVSIPISDFATNSIGQSIDFFPLKVVHKYKNILIHDFNTNPICKIPLKLLVKNISQKEISFRFEALKIHPELKEKSSDFVWQGPATRNYTAMKPDDECEIHIDACMMNPGVYDLNRFSFMFFRDPKTGIDIDPSGVMPRNVIMRIHELESEHILVTVLQSSYQSNINNTDLI